MWGSGSLLEKQKLQKLMFPEGITIDPVLRKYRTSKVHDIFSQIAYISRDSEGQKKDPSVKLTDESSLVDRISELSDLKQGFIEVLVYLGLE